MKETCPQRLRLQQLLDKLEQRAHSCRGLFPVNTQLEFLNLASDHQLRSLLALEDLSSLDPTALKNISLCLERLWRDPSLCQQLLAQALLRHKSITLKTYQPGSSAQENWLLVVQQSLKFQCETACQNKQLKSA